MKLADIVWLEKHEIDYSALKKYWRWHVTEAQMKSQNLDDHSAYLTAICRDQSLHPQDNVTLCSTLIKLLRDQGQAEADEAQKVVDDGLSSFAPSGVTVDPDIKPLWFIWVLQQANSKIIDHHDPDHGEDQNMGLHNLVGQLAMCRTVSELFPACQAASNWMWVTVPFACTV